MYKWFHTKELQIHFPYLKTPVGPQTFSKACKGLLNVHPSFDHKFCLFLFNDRFVSNVIMVTFKKWLWFKKIYC